MSLPPTPRFAHEASPWAATAAEVGKVALAALLIGFVAWRSSKISS